MARCLAIGNCGSTYRESCKDNCEELGISKSKSRYVWDRDTETYGER